MLANIFRTFTKNRQRSRPVHNGLAILQSTVQQRLGYSNYFVSRKRCEQQTINGRLVYIIGAVPYCYQSLAHTLNAINYKRPKAVLLGDYNQQNFGRCKNSPHCLTELVGKLSRQMHKHNFQLTEQKVAITSTFELNQPDWLISIAHLVTQFENTHTLLAKPCCKQLTLQAIKMWHQQLPEFFDKTLAAMQLQNSQFYTYVQTIPKIFEHAAKRLHSGTLYKHMAFLQVEAVKKATMYKDPFMITHEDILERITEILEKNLEQSYEAPREQIQQKDLPLAIAYCSFFFHFDIDRCRDWISEIVDFNEVVLMRQFLQQKLMGLVSKGDMPEKQSLWLTCENTITRIQNRFGVEEKYQILSWSQAEQLRANKDTVVKGMLNQLRELGLVQSAQQIEKYVSGFYTFQNIEKFSKMIGKFALHYNLRLKLEYHHFGKFMPYYAAFLTTQEIAVERRREQAEQQRRSRLPVIDSKSSIADIEREGFSLKGIVSESQGGLPVYREYGSEQFDKQKFVLKQLEKSIQKSKNAEGQTN